MSIDEFLRFVKNKQPPAPSAELVALEDDLGCQLPGDYREFLIACNGGHVGGRLWFTGSTPDGSSADAGVHHVGGFRSESYFSIPHVRAIYGARIPKSLLWIMDDPFGNAICLGLEGDLRGRVFFWDHESEPDPDVWDGRAETAGNIRLLALSFVDFVSGLQPAPDG